jgi:hypothetical protein
VIGPTQRPLPDNTQQSQETDIYAPAGFELNPSKPECNLKSACIQLIFPAHAHCTILHLDSGRGESTWASPGVENREEKLTNMESFKDSCCEKCHYSETQLQEALYMS